MDSISHIFKAYLKSNDEEYGKTIENLEKVCLLKDLVDGKEERKSKNFQICL